MSSAASFSYTSKATHWPLLCAQRACGGRTVVLMKPSLPLAWFDHVVVPVHDEVSGANVISTRGVLNPMRPGDKVPGSALALVGGISKHFGWDNASVLRQLVTLREAWPGLRVTDSRRTPAALREQLQEAFGDAYDDFCERVDLLEDSLPPDFDPERDVHAELYEELTAELPLDPYAARDPAEFFAVASEAFFVAPAPLAQDYPQIYQLLTAYYLQDPLAAANSPR